MIFSLTSFISSSRINELMLQIEQWKRDYTFLLQSNISVPTGDLTDGFELNLYGGNRVRSLYTDAEAYFLLTVLF